MVEEIEKAKILNEENLLKTITRIAHEIIERNSDVNSLVLVGIKRRGVSFAKLIGSCIQKFEGKNIPLGELDITHYRDDLTEITAFPLAKTSGLDVDIVGKNVILCDDVIFTGRTTRAAIDALLSCGRPKTIQLAVIIDRGHRELPIKPDYIGKNVPTSLNEHISVKVKEYDGEYGVSICETV